MNLSRILFSVKFFPSRLLPSFSLNGILQTLALACTRSVVAEVVPKVVAEAVVDEVAAKVVAKVLAKVVAEVVAKPMGKSVDKVVAEVSESFAFQQHPALAVWLFHPYTVCCRLSRQHR